MATSLRRALILDQLYWPSQCSRQQMEKLPYLGSDLFANKFDDPILQEAKLRKTDGKINLR